MVASMCGFKNKQGNKMGQVTYDRFFSNTDGFENETGAFIAPAEGIYLVNFYTHIDSGVPTLQTMQDSGDYYSAYIRYQAGTKPNKGKSYLISRLNGEKLRFEGHVKTSLVGDTEKQDDVTTGRNLVLHLNTGDRVSIVHVFSTP